MFNNKTTIRLRRSYWLITIAALYALVNSERNAYTTVLLAVMIAAGTLSCFLADRQESLERRRRQDARKPAGE